MLDPSFKLAQPYSRFAAFLINQYIILIPCLGFFGVTFLNLLPYLQDLGELNPEKNYNLLILSIFAIAFGIFLIILKGTLEIFYITYFHFKSGQTPGMKYMGIKIVNSQGQLLSFSQALIRHLIFAFMSLLGLFLIFLPFLNLWCIWDSKKQNLYDKMFETFYIENIKQQS